MSYLKKVLQDNLKDIEATRTVSLDDVTNLESIVSEILPEHKGFITNVIPIHKFTSRRTRNYAEGVINSIKTLIDHKDLADAIDTTNIRSTIHRVDEFIKYLSFMKQSVEAINRLLENEKVHETLKTFKYVRGYTDTDSSFVRLDRDVPLLQAINDTDLKSLITPWEDGKKLIDKAVGYGTVNPSLVEAQQQDTSFRTNDVVINHFESIINLYQKIEDQTKNEYQDELLPRFKTWAGHIEDYWMHSILYSDQDPNLNYDRRLTINKLLRLHKYQHILLMAIELGIKEAKRLRRSFLSPNYISYLTGKSVGNRDYDSMIHFQNSNFRYKDGINPLSTTDSTPDGCKGRLIIDEDTQLLNISFYFLIYR